MIIAGGCLYTESTTDIVNLAHEVYKFADMFRLKLWGGGTTPERYNPGIGQKGLRILNYINEEVMPTGTEIHTPDQVKKVGKQLSFIWIGARNCQNYSLLHATADFPGAVMIKRGLGITIDEFIGIYDIMHKIHKKPIMLIERGIVGFDRTVDKRYHIDLNGVIEIKNRRPEIFKNLIVDCSHSANKKEYVADIYTAMKSIGVEHFMFECTLDGISETDQAHMLSVNELKDILT